MKIPSTALPAVSAKSVNRLKAEQVLTFPKSTLLLTTASTKCEISGKRYSIPPVSGRYKVYIIDEVHMLTSSAFNAVLKTLEEPPAHAVFILATTEPQKIPATILSRCMRFDFKLIPQKDLENLIKSVYGKVGKSYEDEAVSAIARAGAGSARDSLSIADTCASYSQGKLTYADVNEVLGSADFNSLSTL